MTTSNDAEDIFRAGLEGSRDVTIFCGVGAPAPEMQRRPVPCHDLLALEPGSHQPFNGVRIVLRPGDLDQRVCIGFGLQEPGYRVQLPAVYPHRLAFKGQHGGEERGVGLTRYL